MHNIWKIINWVKIGERLDDAKAWKDWPEEKTEEKKIVTIQQIKKQELMKPEVDKPGETVEKK